MEKAYVPLGDYFCSDCIDCESTRFCWRRRIIEGFCNYFTRHCRYSGNRRLPLSWKGLVE